MRKEFEEDVLRGLWGSGKPIKLNKKTYRVGKMSYGDYFLEEKKDWSRPETKTHSTRTLWLENKIKKNKYGAIKPIYKIM